jgi:hypothetical protein
MLLGQRMPEVTAGSGCCEVWADNCRIFESDWDALQLLLSLIRSGQSAILLYWELSDQVAKRLWSTDIVTLAPKLEACAVHRSCTSAIAYQAAADLVQPWSPVACVRHVPKQEFSANARSSRKSACRVHLRECTLKAEISCTESPSHCYFLIPSDTKQSASSLRQAG